MMLSPFARIIAQKEEKVLAEFLQNSDKYEQPPAGGCSGHSLREGASEVSLFEGGGAAAGGDGGSAAYSALTKSLNIVPRC